jgi:hypothetical protein
MVFVLPCTWWKVMAAATESATCGSCGLRALRSLSQEQPGFLERSCHTKE